MQKRLAVLDSARKEFIANASHELRTPIFSLAGFVELLDEEDPTRRRGRSSSATMREQVDRLTKLTVDLLDLSKLDADAIQMRRERGRARRRGAHGSSPSSGRPPIDTAPRSRSTRARGPPRDRRPGQGRADHAYPHRQRAHSHAGGNGDQGRDPDISRRDGQRLGEPGRQPTTARASTRARASGSSSASTPATRSAAPASGSRSRRELALRMRGSLELRSRRGAHRVRAAAAGRRRGERLSRAVRLRRAGLRRLLAPPRSSPAAAATATRRPRSPPTTTTTAATTAPSGSSIQAEDGAFDARAIYEAVSPGVVTVISVFGDSGPVDLRRRRRRRRPGLGLRDLRGRRDPHQRPRGHRRRDHRHPDAAAARGERDLRPVRRPQPGRGRGRRLRPVRRRRAAQGRSRRPRPAAAAARLGDRRRRSATPVAAIGSPFGQNQSLSVGVVSATDRSIDSLTDFGIDGALQTDASINPGNSGGPLLDAAGEVVGINQQIQTSSGGNEGVGFAVPIDLAERSVDQLRENGEVAYAYAGVTTQPLYPQLAERLGIDADTGRAGLRGRPGQPGRRRRPAGRRRADPLPGPRGDRRRRRDHRRQRREDRPTTPTCRGSSRASTRATR